MSIRYKSLILNLGSGQQAFGNIRADVTKQKNVNLLCDAHHLPFRPESFSYVYSKNLFEHLSNPMESLMDQVRVLVPFGKLEVITDNASYWRFHIPSKSGHARYQGTSPNDLHYAFFLPMHLKNFFRQIGLQNATINFVGEKSYRITGAINWLLRRIPSFKHFSYGRFKATGVKPK